MAGKNWKDMHKDATTIIEGEFSLVIDTAEATKSQGGKDMIKCKVKVESGPYANRLIYHNFTISKESPAAMRMFFSQMAILGLDAKWWGANADAPVSHVAATIAGRRFIGKVGSKVWQGAAREEIQEFKPATGGATRSVGAAAAAQGLSRGSVQSNPTTVDEVPPAVATELASAQPSTPPPAEPAF
jgi:hypothetical protein